MAGSDVFASASITPEEAEANRRYLQGLREKYAWTLKLRPAELIDFAGRLTWPVDRRRVVATITDTLLYMDPFTHGGMTVVRDQRYDQEAEEHLKELVKPGSRCLDIGANEGILSALMARLSGDNGYVACVEPQSRLQDIIRINVRLNSSGGFRLYQNVFGGPPGQEVEIALFPLQNTGSTGIHRTPRMAKAKERVVFVDPAIVFHGAPESRFDVVKVDVEGHEDAVVESLRPFLREGRVGTLLLEYHDFILRGRSVEPESIEIALKDGGMQKVAGPEPTTDSFTRLVVYHQAR
ncbi:MAG: FkbM family methyltransferase [Fimbriimonadaceae bacterium]